MAFVGPTTLDLGLDDTDMLDDAGTGQLARSLARLLSGAVHTCRVEGVSRHQLLQEGARRRAGRTGAWTQR